MDRELLIEIGVEELPAAWLPGLTAQMSGCLEARLKEYRIAPAGLANADQIMRYGIMLPCHPTMTREDCEYVYQTIEDFIGAKGEVTVAR